MHVLSCMKSIRLYSKGRSKREWTLGDPSAATYDVRQLFRQQTAANIEESVCSSNSLAAVCCLQILIPSCSSGVQRSFSSVKAARCIFL